jgi:hypothetical protein
MVVYLELTMACSTPSNEHLHESDGSVVFDDGKGISRAGGEMYHA